MTVAADYDGTWTDHEEIRKEVDFIVTGRTWMDPNNEDEIQDVPIPVFFNPVSEQKPTLSQIVTHKAHVINESKADKFYEDQQEQGNLLKILCPECKIVVLHR